MINLDYWYKNIDEGKFCDFYRDQFLSVFTNNIIFERHQFPMDVIQLEQLLLLINNSQQHIAYIIQHIAYIILW